MSYKYEEVYLTEKDSQVEALAPVLGCKYTRKWYPAYSPDKKVAIVPLQGHLIELYKAPAEYDEKFKVWSEETIFCFPDKFKTKPKERTKELLHRAVEHLKSAKKIIIATDFDNEGAALAMRVIEYAGVEDRVSHMLEMGSVDEQALKNAIANPINIPYREMANAGYARAYLDWAEGMTLSRALTVHLAKKRRTLIFGGVKTPLLNMVVERDLQFETHKNKKYYYLTGKATAQGKTFDISVVRKTVEEKEDKKTGKIKQTVKFVKEIDQKDFAEKLKADILEKGRFKVTEASQTDKKENPPQLYDLTSIQAEMSGKFKLNPDQSLALAQKLYDTYKIQTYPRTAIRYLKEEEYGAVSNILNNLAKIMHRQHIVAILSGTIPKRSSVFNSKKVTSHGAIAPTLKDPSGDYESLGKHEKAMFDLVAERYIENFMAPYEFEEMSGKAHLFDDYYATFKENRPKKAGYKLLKNKNLQKEIEEYENQMPDLSKGEEILITEIEVKEGETKPKPRFTMETLLNSMKRIASLYPESEEIKKYLGENGIGTPATRAQILKELMTPDKNGNVLLREEKGKIISTPLARELIRLTPRSIVSPVKRAKLNEYLVKIEKGEITIDQLLDYYKDQLKKYVAEIAEMGKDPAKTYVGEDREFLGKCPLCDGQIYEGKASYMCSNAKWTKEGEKFVNKGCTFSIFKGAFKNLGVKTIPKTTVAQLLKKGEVNMTFKSKAGKSYRKPVVIDKERGVKVVFDQKND